jgi:hypothetical protein
MMPSFGYPTEVKGMFISEPYQGFYYIAEPSRKGVPRYLWSIMPVEPTAADSRIDASLVPYRIRKQAYTKFYNERKV